MLRPFAWNHKPRENVCTRALQGLLYQNESGASLHDCQQCCMAVVAFVCVHRRTTQQVSTSANNPQHCWANNVVTCCDRLHRLGEFQDVECFYELLA